MSGDELLSVKQAAELLGVSEDTVRRAYDAGELKGERTRPLIGNRRISRKSLEEFRARRSGDSGTA